jgi:hypothetical protein
MTKSTSKEAKEIWGKRIPTQDQNGFSKKRLFVREHPDAYLREIAEKFGTTLQAGFYACKRLKISIKKDSLLRGER